MSATGNDITAQPFLQDSLQAANTIAHDLKKGRMRLVCFSY